MSSSSWSLSALLIYISFTKLWFNVINWKLIVWASGQNLKSLSWLSLQNNFRGSAECWEKGNISARFIWSSFLYAFIFKQSGTVFRYDCTNIANISPFHYKPLSPSPSPIHPYQPYPLKPLRVVWILNRKRYWTLKSISINTLKREHQRLQTEGYTTWSCRLHTVQFYRYWPLLFSFQHKQIGPTCFMTKIFKILWILRLNRILFQDAKLYVSVFIYTF